MSVQQLPTHPTHPPQHHHRVRERAHTHTSSAISRANLTPSSSSHDSSTDIAKPPRQPSRPRASRVNEGLPAVVVPVSTLAVLASESTNSTSKFK